MHAISSWAARDSEGIVATLKTRVKTLAASPCRWVEIALTLWDALWVSNQAIILGFALAVIVGTARGLLIGRWRASEQFIDPYLNMLRVLPMSALIPVLIMATGLGMVTRVLVVFLFAVFVITREYSRRLECDGPSLG